jgi:hypothetical protein
MMPREVVPVRSTTSTAMWIGGTGLTLGLGVGGGVSEGLGVSDEVGVETGVGATLADPLGSSVA